MFRRLFHAKTEKPNRAPAPPSAAQTFLVDTVVPETKPIFTEPLAEHVAKRFRRKLLLIPEPHKPVTNMVFAQFNSIQVQPARRVQAEEYGKRLVSRCHALTDAVSLAFSGHRPLVLTPDSIWLTIEQGFAHHLTQNAEALRSRLVRHQGKRELMTQVFELSLSTFEGALADFSAQIRDASDPVLHETLICDFSTTTPAVRTASEVVLMDAYSSYFTYGVNFVCGIPKITVTGSPQDWQRIRSRVEVLATYDLEWWVTRLRPILDEFVETANGRPNLEFWQAICKPKRAYGDTTITGWVADLFPYLNDPPHRRRSHVFQFQREHWAIPVESGVETRRGLGGEPGAEKGVATGSFPSGLASVPIKLSFRGGSKNELDLVAGFFAVEQNPHDLALSPLISWSLTERPPAAPVWI
jgi:hypothetical protein